MLLIVGKADEYLIDIARGYSSNSQLITEENFRNPQCTVGYTGPEEFSNHNNFIELLLSADSILYQPPLLGWGDENQFDINTPQSTTRGRLENLLLKVNQHVPVSNLVPLGKSQVNTMFSSIDIVDQRVSNSQQLWGFGCSYAYGEFVDPTERYINRIAEELNLPVSCLARPCSSIEWSADQILRSDIRANDIVVWGLTTKNRFMYYSNNQVQHININSSSTVVSKELILNDDYWRYVMLSHILQVTNFCNKIGAKLLLVGLLTGDDDLIYLTHLPNFYQFFNGTDDVQTYIDYASDNKHPGPKHHQLVANSIIKQLYKRNLV